MEKKVDIKLSNKIFYTIVAVLLITLLAVSINALIPGVAPDPGHTLDNVAPPSGCAANEFLKWNDPNWDCVGDSYIQRRVSQTCPIEQSIRVINTDGSVLCEDDDVGTSLTLNPEVYEILTAGEINIGTHLACFITEVTKQTAAIGHGLVCRVYENPLGSGSWRLVSSADLVTCTARCLD